MNKCNGKWKHSTSTNSYILYLTQLSTTAKKRKAALLLRVVVVYFVYYCPAHLCQPFLVPCPLEALVPVGGVVGPEVPQPVQLLHLSGGRLPGEEHAAVQQPHRVKRREQAHDTEHPEPRSSDLHERNYNCKLNSRGNRHHFLTQSYDLFRGHVTVE